jgi:hypothetical protein
MARLIDSLIPKLIEQMQKQIPYGKVSHEEGELVFTLSENDLTRLFQEQMAKSKLPFPSEVLSIRINNKNLEIRIKVI